MGKLSSGLKFSLALIATIAFSSTVFAQQAPVAAPNAPQVEAQTELSALGAEMDIASSQNATDVAANIEADNLEITEMGKRIQMHGKQTEPVFIPSLFFTKGEHNLLVDARKGYVSRPVTDGELASSEQDQLAGQTPIKGPRELALGGIVYVSSGDWTIWLNGQKITPQRLPREVLDIRVNKEFVRLKWFDAYTNQVFPVMLRSHQRFNIDTRIFLPG